MPDFTPEQMAEIERSPQFLAAVAAHQVRATRSAVAQTAALPGALADAFPTQPVRVGPLTLLEMRPAHRLLLEQIDSPLIRQMREAVKPPFDPSANPPQPPGSYRQEVRYTDEEVFEALYVLVNPPPAGRAALAKGRPQFREMALAATADVLPMDCTPQIIDAIVEVFRRAFAPQVSIVTASVPGEGGEENFPTAASALPTGSAGGSRLSPVSPATGTPGAASSGSPNTSP